MMWSNGGFGFTGMIIGNILFALIVAAIVILIIRLVTGRGHYHSHYHGYYNGEGKNGAMDILKERYAKGEITKEQFDNMKKDLGLN